MKKIIYSILLLILSSCVQHSFNEKALSIIDSLQCVNKTLTQQYDELLNGEVRLIKLIEFYNTKQDYIKAYDSYNILKAKHPESKYIIVNQDILSSIESKALIIMDSINKVKKDSIRFANIKELGIWKLGEYINDFDEPTGEKYVYTNILGRFSNIATSNSSLRVNILINKKK